ncbi:MAG: NAD(+) diphosphatase [Bacteroidota bacterium]|jgi:NAD+ diphosphatase|nr:NAD(+) diphosphatase [Ignavibacteria bacterium]MCU7498465.1 NAD(+) diphosphatase [Ignavibacteria bacterium]MCU7512637.1 NAD(+) diphosphatase [Ignavibacteria bacterium]MCU7521245.1 NAD(+) diphosphatase [Ignavibacteria bacterium]MCU7525031.1 NAD(+) diphosphatase [Ignavibacteria bacterium]
MNFVPGIKAPENMDGPVWWFLFKRDELLVLLDGNRIGIPFIEDLAGIDMFPERMQYLGTLKGSPCFTAELPLDTEAPQGMAFRNLRSLLGEFESSFFALAGRAFQVKSWDLNHQYCGRCGSMTEERHDERAKVCPSCGLVSYPRISPAVIVAITNKNRILLARASRFKSNMYSVLAGFVEAGETFEDCIRREIMEEANIGVKNIKYFGSQPWPFPDSLMVGFTAEYASGELRADGVEIVELKWFSPEGIPAIPGKWSIARRLIDWFIDNYKEREDI